MSSVDAVTGENVSYTYDSLNRLIAAATSGKTGVQWGDSYSYDGFGNLTSKVETNGTAPSVYPQVNSNTNQARMLNDYGFDANGNWLGSGAWGGSQVNTWNVENQLISDGSVDYGGNLLTYTYDPWGKRVLQYSVGGAFGPTGTLYFYSITGQRLATYTLDYLTGTQTAVSMYFGGRLLAAVDRLGSVRDTQNGSTMAYYPWGEERTSTPDGNDKFATYFRDLVTQPAGFGEDYASARYYNNNFGRFWSPDPSGRADPGNPQSWNQYAYAGNDPVNFNDPTGLISYNGDNGIPTDPCGPYGYWMGEGCYNNSYGFSAYPNPPMMVYVYPVGPGGPSGGAASWKPAKVDQTSNEMAMGLLSNAFKSFAKSNCAKVFAQDLSSYSTASGATGFSVSAFENEAATANFYNVNNPNYQSLTQNQVSNNGSSVNISSGTFTGPYADSTAITIAGGTANPAVLLGAEFFSNTNTVFQTDVLIHELLHAMFNGLGDQQMFSAFANAGLTQGPYGDTENISAWISTDCHSTPTSMTWWNNGAIP
ncbi:MAG: RHS repeat-associated core domain-containing protein [Bryobacteraceae bacterium]